MMQGMVSGQVQTNQHLTSLDQRVGQLRESTNDALHVMDDRIRVLETPWKLLRQGWVVFGAGVGVAAGAAALMTRLDAWPF